ncbi:MAG TPA: hypothetical protein VJ715_09290 [Pyrinomonadaceae bacterium]|nr:hypothetical protein [Pyrinomonadaceae bacterium]
MVYLTGHFDRKRHRAGDKFRLSCFEERESVTVESGARGRQREGKNGPEINEKPVKAGEPGHF